MARAAIALVAMFLSLPAIAAESARNAAPAYSGASAVNAATNLPGPLAPLALVSLYGTDLAVTTRSLSNDDLRGGLLPTTISGTGVSITVDNVAAPILFVSPQQVNFLIPGNIRPGRRTLRLVFNGRTGPDVDVQLADSSPGLFVTGLSVAIATKADGSLITAGSPAVPGDIVVLYAAGLGTTQPAFNGLSIPNTAAWITARQQFALLLNDEPLPDDHILYAGVTPGFAGLYQINFRLPENVVADPEIRLRLPGQMSQAKIFLPVRPR